ncbi:MAG: dUTP diphosphatase [Candidatus Ryanbacteria bacterium CG10_big_fil_rev_8_21_14_0_10_43_42]|uniref:dUTP diphosphatase n=1 Tax=Candidatus Ryanbacteria bacterium CG10_big_fil_rev_8_21_14_0_10_43_42 TaxID=1974864 RepID=A0A2M8KX25_9BACT|nr:MAG: dUTP diphosphatase [Candidatus Ryanbacteria bacterium CG10_big_fil_rev_8_21_14_0_10_43_42]
MKISIKRIDKTLPLPEYKTEGAAAFDMYARVDVVIEPGTIGIIPSNLIIKSPPDYVLIMASRSSTPKRGLIIPHGIGIVDGDYCGNKDELGCQVYNITKDPVHIKRGERIGQALFVRLGKVSKWEETDSMENNSRGGFGSTGIT